MKNNYLLTGLFMAVMLMVSMPLSAGTYSGGDGLSSSTPYQIATTDDLIELSNTPGDWGAYFIQTADIAFDSDETLVDWDGDGTLEHGSSGDDTYGFSPIGDAGFDDNFTGSYDGNEKTISNLFINRPDDDYIGLFGGTDGGATISNIGVTNVDITALSDVGGLVGWNYDATVSNSYTTGSVHAEYPDYGGYNVGGIVGVNGGTILNSYSTASVSGYSDIGGLVGNNDYGTISKCYAAGSVSGTGDDISGLVGSGLGDDVDDSFWDTETSGQSSSDGGTGKTTSKMKDVATFTDETNTTGLDNAWDFVTNPNDDNADNDYWDMDQEGTVNNYYPILSWQNGADDFLEMPTYSGGDGSSDTPYQIASINDLIALSNYYTHWDKDFIQTANITFNPDENQVDWNGDGNAGPAKGFSAIGNSSTKFTGEYDGDGYTIDNLYMNNPSSGTYFALFGYTDGATITDIGLTNVNITGSAYVGGLVGLTVNSSNVSNSYITGSVSGSTAVGGLVGYNENSTVSNCYSTCSMSGGDVVGGLVGYHTDSGTISNCYSTGSVNGDDVVGGLVGVTFRSSTVSKCYSTGNVSGSSDVGGLVGENYATINNSYSTGNVTRKTTGTTADIGDFVDVMNLP
ncbi:MAG: GLUG motif-containing protein [Candidatus Marinimicrobia bacterium]|nr:GLUG motif-containing protein [Candidatus Neomarinimicrobiota bacterium]